MVFGVHVAVGAGAGYSIELGVEAFSGLSEVMILANLMSRLKVHAWFHCRFANLQDLLRRQCLEESHEPGDTTHSPSCSSSGKNEKRVKQIKHKHTRFRKC